MKIYKYILEIAIFICGAIVMIFELFGSRVLGPYFGTSIFVWTSLIGIILGSEHRREEMKELLDYGLKIQGINPPLHG